MSVSVTMPQLGETVTEGTILRWAKQPGDTIDEDEVLLEISTDKGDTEGTSPGRAGRARAPSRRRRPRRVRPSPSPPPRPRPLSPPTGLPHRPKRPLSPR